MLSNEQPIKRREEDFLNRKYFADHLTNAIVNYKDNNNASLTIGLYGKWGSGKTSIINMVSESLSDDKDFIILNFEPWLFSDTNQLVSSFFKEFAQKINYNSTKSDDMKLIGEKLEVYAGFFDVLSLVPEPSVSILSKASSMVFSNVGKASKKLGKAHKKDLASTKKDIESHLGKLDKKILIIIDDIDRLNNTEIKQVFQLIKALGNFPNTVYLSSMDKDVVVNALSEVQQGDGNEYLEKIINVPIEIPQLSKPDVDKFLLEKLNDILKDFDEKDLDQTYWGNVFHSGYKNFFSNIRDVIRYMNILRFNHDALQNNVNIIDLMAITAFQVFEPKIYEFMKYNKDLLSGQESDSMYRSTKENKEILKNELEKCKESLQKIDEKSFINLLKEVFIKVKEAYSNTHYSGELSRLRKASKVASPEYYDAYFSLTLTETLSNREIKDIITKTTNEDDFSNAIFELIKDNRITVFLQRFQDFTQDDIPKENFQVIFNVFMNIGDFIPEDKRGMFSFGNSIEVMRIFYQLCKQLDNEVDIYNMYKEAIQNSVYSIFTACQEVSIIMQQHGEYEEKEEKPEKLVSKEQLQELKKVLLKKINNWVKDSSLFEHNKALYIMYLWKRLNEKECLSYITNNISNEEGLLKFIKIFFSYSSSHSINDYVERKTKTLNYKAIKDFIDVEKIIPDIQKLSSSELNEIEKFCVETFIGFYDKKIKDDIF